MADAVIIQVNESSVHDLWTTFDMVNQKLRKEVEALKSETNTAMDSNKGKFAKTFSGKHLTWQSNAYDVIDELVEIQIDLLSFAEKFMDLDLRHTQEIEQNQEVTAK